MSEFEMIEKLMEKENVSFEEAADVLRACNGDLVEAVISLERKARAEEEKAEAEKARIEAEKAEAERARIEAEKAEAEKARAEAEAEKARIEAEKAEAERAAANAAKAAEDRTSEDAGRQENRKETGSSFGIAVKSFFRKAKDILLNNSLIVSRKGEEIVRIPAWLAVIPVIFAFHLTAVVLIVSLFVGCRYSFSGKNDLSSANEFMDKASDMAEELKTHLN